MPALFEPVASLRGRSVAAVTQFTRKDIIQLMSLALQIRDHIESGKTIDALHGRILSLLFFEDSSRTLSSFTAAMLRLGGQVIDFKVDSSSVNKGETLQDTVRVLDAYSDVIVLRHPRVEALDEALAVAAHPIMNAGNGSGEHPSQALLDVLTMQVEFGSIDGLTIAMIGDLKMGRTVHSLLKLLARNFDLTKVYLVAAEGLEMPQSVLDAIMADLKANNTALVQVSALSPAIVAECDVLYCTRLQKERFLNSDGGADALVRFEKAMSDIRVDAARMKDAKSKMIVMHPLPRVDEISTDVDNDPRAAYFRQMRYGLFMRMAILYSVLS